MIANISPSPSCNIYQSDAYISCKSISDKDNVSRAYFTPRMGNEQEYIWQNIFQFPASDGLRESVIWRVILEFDNCVHSHNLNLLKMKKAKNPSLDENYSGFFTANTQNIRSKTTGVGHGFNVYHAPNEGNWHAEIVIILKSGYSKLSKNDKQDVRAIMQELFKPNFTLYIAE
jgi:hypothetical protein